MPKIKIYLCLLLLCWFGTSYSQELGFYQRRVFIEVDGQGQLPVFQNLFGETMGYRVVNDQLVKSYNVLDAGFRISLNVTNEESSSFGLELEQKFYWLNMSNGDVFGRKYVNASGSTIEEAIRANIAFIPMREMQIMPRVTVSLNDSRAPLGFASEFGIGYDIISIGNRHPGLKVDSLSPYSVSQVDALLLDARVSQFRGLNFMYGFRLNMPINKHLLFHVGFRYQYNYLFGRKKYRRQEESEYWFSSQEIWQKVNLRRQLSIISFGAGFTIVL